MIVPCKGRLRFLQRSMSRVIEATDFNVCLVDYSCPEKCGEWFEKEFPDRGRERRLIVERVPDQPFFNKSAAHNAGAWRALREGADYFCFLDADTLVDDEFAPFVRREAREDRFLIAGLRPDGSDLPSMTGLLVTPASTFAELGGFDESYRGWGGEDVEMRFRLHLVGGLDSTDVPLHLAKPIPHGNYLRTQFYEERDPAVSNAANLQRIVEKIRGEWKVSEKLHLPSTTRLWFHGPDPLALPAELELPPPLEPSSEGPRPAVAGRAKISCLCVTENRPEFIPWLLWNFDRQTYPHKELILVDSSPVPFETNRPDVRVISMPPGTNVPQKRNRALAEAWGDYVAWFDDDDWQHPERLTRLEAALTQAGATYGGCSRSYFLDLHADGARPYNAYGYLIFNGALFRRDAVAAVRFDESRWKASDTPWLRELGRKLGSPLVLRDEVLCMWLCHESNISNPRSRRRFPDSVSNVAERLGQEIWADTAHQIALLKASLPLPAATLDLTKPTRAAVLQRARVRSRATARRERTFSDPIQEAHGEAADNEHRVGETSGPRVLEASAVEPRWSSTCALWTLGIAEENGLVSSWRRRLSDSLGVQLLPRTEEGGTLDEEGEFVVLCEGYCLVSSRFGSFYEEALRRLRAHAVDWIGCFPAHPSRGGGTQVRTGQLVDRAVLGPTAIFDREMQLYRGGSSSPQIVIMRRAALKGSLSGGIQSVEHLQAVLSEGRGGIVPSQDAWSARWEPTSPEALVTWARDVARGRVTQPLALT